RGADREVRDWLFGARSARPGAWRRVFCRVIVPSDVSSLLPRVTGNGPSRVWLEGFRLSRVGNVRELRQNPMPKRLSLRNRRSELVFDTDTAAFEFRSKASGRRWTQKPGASVHVKSARLEGKRLVAELWSGADAQILSLVAELDATRPEARLSLTGKGELSEPLAYPHPWSTRPGMDLVFPLNEGVAFPAGEPGLPEQWLHLYGGHGLCMPFYCQTDGDACLLTVVDTPDDALARFVYDGPTMVAKLLWEGQKGRFSYPRRWRYELFDRGGYVAAAKRYREIARGKGLLVTMRQKRSKVPAVDLLVGSPNVWVFGDEPVRTARSLRESGFQRMLWSGGGSAADVRAISAMGFLVGEYDIYQDCMDPAQFRQLQWTHPQWTSDQWPDGIVLRADGSWEPGWDVETKDGGWIACGVLCDLLAPDVARKRIAAVLREKPFGARFIDTTTASPWRECYHPRHPMTRTESRKAKMDLLRLLPEEFGLVAGSETGHEAAVPWVSYFEGMLSLGPFRVPDAGRNMERTVDPAPESLRKFQVGHRYRVPLWELVFHDCVCSHWYWGDYQNKVPSVWRQRDLFNILYGTAPMFLFRAEDWPRWKVRMMQTYRDVVPVARAVGYEEMTDHRWLTPDRRVQQTRFANGWVVTVNFGEQPFRLPSGRTIEGLGFQVERPKAGRK
ncbi:MAG: glycoside hydrolase, partial [Fimbriimonadales bacterium]